MSCTTMSTDALWNIEEVSDFLHVSTKTIRRWVGERSIPYIKLGGSLRFDRDDISEWIETKKRSAQ